MDMSPFLQELTWDSSKQRAIWQLIPRHPTLTQPWTLKQRVSPITLPNSAVEALSPPFDYG